jgi:D-3-phosphoglycerate dehydrogenase
MEAFGRFPDLRVDKPEHTVPFDEDQMCELILGRDAVIVGTDKVTARVISKARKLKIISKHGVGVDNIDVAAATEAGIIVTYLPGMNDRAVADMTFGLILALSRGICLANKRVKHRDWSKVLVHDVWGKTLGVIGTGRIGQAVIRRALAFDMKVVAYDVFPNNEVARALGFTYVSLNELLVSADIVTVHVPLSPETRGMIGARELERMKETAYLINTARGGVIDEPALVEALKSKAIAGAALDVYEKSLPDNEAVYELDNLLITPHIAAYTYETLEAMDMAQVDEYRRILRGDLPINILNREVKGLGKITG